MNDKPLNITAFFDTRPGHGKQTRGVLNALAKLTPVAVTEANLPQPNARTQAWQWAAWIFRTEGPPAPESLPRRPDLILGTGTHTHLPMLLYKRACGARAVTCMSPSSLLISHFDLCLVPEHDAAKPGDNIFYTLGPPNTALSVGAHDPDRGLIAVGGIDHKSHHWDSESVLNKVQAIAARRPQVHWTVTSSFRTPADMLPRLGQLARDHDNCAFFEAGQTGPGWIEEQYAASDACWVTADSISMIYEALSAGCKVGVLPVAWKNPRGKLARSVNALLDQEMILDFDQWSAGAKNFGGRRTLDEAGRAAREIMRRWWPDRLP